MAQKAVVSFLWENHLPALIRFLERQPCTVLAVSANPTARAQQAIEAAGGKLVLLDSFLDGERLADIRNDAEKRVQQFRSGQEAAWDAFCQQRGLDPATLGAVFVANLLPRLEEQMVLVDSLAQAHQHYDIQLVVVSEDLTRYPRTAVEWARGLGIPSLHVLHGQPFATPYTVHRAKNADAMAVYAPRTIEAYEDAGIDVSGMRCTGNPAWDYYPNTPFLRPEFLRQMREKHGLPNLPLVMFGTTWVSKLTATSALSLYETTLRQFLHTCATLKQAGVKACFVIKDRPSNSRFGKQVAIRLATEVGLDKDDYCYATEDAVIWVMAADIVVSVDSNLSVEAMMAAVPAINLMNEPGLRVGPSFDAESGVLEVHPDELASTITTLLTDPTFRHDQLWRMKKRVTHYNASVDGLAGLRVAEFMAELARPVRAVPMKATKKRAVWRSLGSGAGEREAHEVYADNPRREVVAMFARPPRRVLELGCSTGATGKLIKELYPQAWVAGVELSAEAAKIARARLDVVICQKFEEADPESHGIAKGSIDTVILADVLEHMYDPWGVLLKLRPYLSRDAQVLASIPNARNLWLMNELSHGRFPYDLIGLLDITHIRFFTRSEIEKLFAETGYEVAAFHRNLDPRLARLQFQPGMNSIETEKIVLKEVSQDELEDLKTLQFVVLAHPDAAAQEEDEALPEQVPARKRLVVYSLEYQPTACPQIRFIKPFEHLKNEWELVWAVQEKNGGGVWNAAPIATADLIVFHRIFPGPEAVEVIEAAFASGKPVIYETDDLLTDLPPGNLHAQEYAHRKPYIEAVIRRAHAVVVSSNGLEEHYRPLNAHLVVLPNLVDFQLFYQPVPDAHAVVRIGVLGTSARQPDFAVIEPVLKEVCKKQGDKVQVVFVGHLPEGWENRANVQFVPFSPDYDLYAVRLKDLHLDIALAPLEESAFNRCKSAIKWLEFSAIGATGIYSDVPAYRGFVEHGKTGLMVGNTPQEWRNALNFLIEDADRRREIAMQAQLEILRGFALQKKAHVYGSVYGQLLKLANPAAGEGGMDVSGAVATVMPEEAPPAASHDFYALWQSAHGYQDRDAMWMAERMSAWKRPVRIHLAVIAVSGDEAALELNLRSMLHQFHKNWLLTIVAECDAPAGIEDIPQVVWRNRGDMPALAVVNEALASEGCDWVGLFEAGDRLAPHAFFAFVDALETHASWRMVYSDEDALLEDGSHDMPYFKPEFDIDLLRCAPYAMGGLMLYERRLFGELAGFGVDMEGVEYFDLSLRAWEKLGESGIGHVADVLYHRSVNGGHAQREVEAQWAARERALAGHLARVGLAADLEEGLLPGTYHPLYQLPEIALVSVVIAVNGRVEALQRCLEGLTGSTDWPNLEIVLIDDGEGDAEARAFLAALAQAGHESLRVMPTSGKNRAASFNAAAAACRGAFVLFLGVDSAMLHADWLTEMMGYAWRADVGAVGARLVDAEGQLTHAGLVLGLGDMPAGRIEQGVSANAPGYFGRLQTPCHVSALAMECLLLRTSTFLEMHGFDATACGEQWFAVDYALRLHARGLHLVWTPFATLINGHVPAYEVFSAAMTQTRDTSPERLLMYDRWLPKLAADPAYNRNLCLSTPFQVEIAQPLTLSPAWRPRPRVLSIHADRMGCGEYRIIAPMRALNEKGRVLGWDSGSYLRVSELQRLDPDAIVFQRQVNWDQIELMEAYLRHSQAFRVFEIDDLITNIPIKSSRKQIFVEQKDLHKRFRKAVGLCQRFVVSTDFLAESYRGYTDEIVVVPNFLERARWDGFNPARRTGRKPRVGWAGSTTHQGDLHVIIDVVKATAQEVDWVFFGMCPKEVRHLVREFHEPVKLGEYAAHLASLNLDLAIAPLEDVPFNHGKSHLRLLEYGVLGYPVICTDLSPYAGAFPVTRVQNRFKDWVEAIRSHVADLDELARRGDALRDHIQKNWMLEDHLDVWERAWLP